MSLIYTVPQSHCVIIERFGKFARIQNTGVNFRIPILEKIKNVFDAQLSAINFGTSINGCYESGRWAGNYGGQGAHHVATGWVDINQNSNWKMNFFIETCIETSGSPIKKQIVLTE